MSSPATRTVEAPDSGSLRLGLIVLALLAVVGYLSTVAIDGGPLDHAYRASAELPAEAPVLKDGDEVRIAGQRAGQVREVVPGKRGGSLVTFDLSDADIGRDASVRARLRGLSGAVYLDLQPGHPGRGKLPDGGLIAPARTSASTDLSRVIETFDAETRRALSASLRGYGNGLAGRGPDLNDTLARLGPAARELTPVLEAAAPAPGVLSGLLGDANRFVRGLGAGGRLAGLVSSARETFEPLAERPVALAGAIEELPRLEDQSALTLPVADLTLADVAAAANDLRPASAALRAAAPSLRALVYRRRELRRLGQLGLALRPVVRRARPVLILLRPAAGALAPLALPLEPLATYLSRYGREIFVAPDGFRRWGGFRYPQGRASGHKAVRFSMVFTCQRARDAYPAPGAAEHEDKRCAF